ncbi:putative C2H2 finger domain protein [Aspergillus lucknowensis]|uniref:C2H2-type domain-containing protein n=1 Tax=Aspergillus lucknowensis TaxID=176173 RepID=A0ABR4LRX2_9EURO
MVSNIKTDPENLSLSQTMLHMDHSQSRHIPGNSQMASVTTQDDELLSQDNFSLCSSTAQSRDTSEMKHWTLNDLDSTDSNSIASTKPDSPAVQMLSLSLSQHALLHSAVGASDIMYSAGSEFHGLPDVEQSDMDFSKAQDFSHYTSLFDFSAFENDANGHSGSHSSCTPDQGSPTGDSQLAPSDSWNIVSDTGYNRRSTMDHFTGNLFQHVPVSPPLTEASNDVSVTTSCSHPGYPAYMSHEDAMLKDITATPVGAQGINLGDPIFPLTPPLNEQDPSRTIRPSKSARRPTLQLSQSQPQVKQDPEFFPPLPVKEPLRPRSKDGPESRNPRDHPYYSLPTHNDGKYYCPFANGDKPCNHPPTTQKCAYHKYLDSHLKPYRCRVPSCMDAQLQFSSNACLFRHEREAHGLHGHGDNPHLCLFEGCDRSIPGYGFPRRWNLFDHMRRVHDYASSEHPSSPDASPTTGATKKKETTGRKRRVTGVSGAQTMKRTRSTQSQTNPLKALQQTAAHHGQNLQAAERNYYNCHTRLTEQLRNITPQDSAMHDKVNASLQELITLGITYRQAQASQAVAQIANGLPA